MERTSKHLTRVFVSLKLRVTLFLGVLALASGLATNPTRAASGPPPILLVTNSAASNPFGGYLAEILRAEGLNSFATADLATLTALELSSASLVILAETPLTAEQATTFSDYVASGGRLIAMRPDARLAPALGITLAGGSLDRPYLAIDTTGGSGEGFTAATLPIKGAADLYTLEPGAYSTATLYADQTTATAFPAVVRYESTATWAFDLAHSVAYTRQGDPALSGLDRDGIEGIRTFDVFYDDIDKDRVSIPHADVQMRLLGRVIRDLLADVMPLPALWHFPGAARSLLVVTSDTHGNHETAYNGLLSAVEARGGQATVYIARYLTCPTSTQMDAWRAAGHEFGLHPYFTEDGVTVEEGYQRAEDWFTSQGWLTWSRTVRHHMAEWPTWADVARTMALRGVGMDTSMYSSGPALTYANGSQAHGFINGSGLPMRIVDEQGRMVDVYSQTTSIIDEQLIVGDDSEHLTPEAASLVTRQMIDDSQDGGHSALVAQFHLDYFSWGEVMPWVLDTLDYAQSLGIPIWSAERWLDYTEARAASTMTGIAWSPVRHELSFNVTLPAGAEPHTIVVPAVFGQHLSGVTVDGTRVDLTRQTINGRSLKFFDVSPGVDGAARSVVVTYGMPPPEVSVSDATVTEGQSGVTTATFTVSLSAESEGEVTVDWATVDGSAIAGLDYEAGAGTVTFPAGVTSRLVTVNVIADTLVELDETFALQLSVPTGAMLADGLGLGTILNDDVGLDGDADGDGLPDAWEVRFGLDPHQPDALDDPDGDGATNASEYAAGTHPRGFHTRYFAEGATGPFFTTELAMLNPGATAANVLLRYQRSDGHTLPKYVRLSARSRATEDVADNGGFAEAEFATVVESDEPIVAERTMRWDETGYGSHGEIGALAPLTTWYFAEGATHSGFSTFYLLQNPGTSDAAIRVTYLKAVGAPVVNELTLAAGSRRTIWANQNPELAGSDISAIIESTNGVPIVSERAMYLDRAGQLFGAGHESAGIPEPRSAWFFAEGATGPYFDLFLLLANPHGSAAQVEVRYLLPSGATITRSYTVPANSRYNIWVDQQSGLEDTAVSTTLTSTNGVTFLAERSMWWPGSAATWQEAHNSPGATAPGPRWGVAGGECGGSRSAETYVLIANTAATSATVRATVYGALDITSERTYVIAANARFNIPVCAGLSSEPRFGVVVESVGGAGQLVVEKTVYSNAGGVAWAAGTSVLGEPLR